MFSISKEAFGSLTLCKILNTHTGEYFSFFPDFGASLQQLALKDSKGKLHTLWEESADYHHLITEGKKKYRGSKLFPFPNRIRDGVYSFESVQYQLPINEVKEGHAHHGLVFQSSFTIVEEKVSETEGSVTVAHVYDSEVDGYPFRVRLLIVFLLQATGFSCTTLVKNEDEVKVPFSDGWHPYFKLATSVEDYVLSIPSAEEVEVDERMIPTGNNKYNGLFLQGKQIGNAFFDTCFRLPKKHASSILLKDGKEEVTLNIWLNPPYRYLHVYTPPSRQCIALEPMTSPADVFNNKIDLLVLAPGESTKLVWGVSLVRSS